MPEEARLLKAYGELPDMRLHEVRGGLEEDDEDDDGGYVEFEDPDIDRL
ncbi:hypothetical protein OROGR_003870 [Orobanche gracilis]